jgi:hypothetical protein
VETCDGADMSRTRKMRIPRRSVPRNGAPGLSRLGDYGDDGDWDGWKERRKEGCIGE